MKKKVFLLQHYFNDIGGIETFLINWCKVFKDKYDITLICEDISVMNALMLSKYCNLICEQLSETVECDILIITSVLVDDKNFRKIKYKRIFRMIHSDWTEMKKIWDYQFIEYGKDTQYISVSQCAKEGLKKEFQKDSIVIPNILVKEEHKKPLKILSATRLTEEKGYFRMKALCDLFEKYKIPYIWDVFGTNPLNEKGYKNMFLHPPIKNVQEIMKGYDYVAQLSTTESFNYTLYEALMQNVPVLVTPFPNAKQEIINGENGYIIPFDIQLSEDDIIKIYNNIPTKASYEQKGVVELWTKILG